MAAIPKRSALALPYRFVLEKLEKYLRFPVKNPNFYTILAVLLSFLFLVVTPVPYRIILLIVILLLDWLDGAAARKFTGVSHNGYVVDLVFDKVSDGIIVASILGTSYGKVLFLLYLINNCLSYYAIKTGKHYIMAIRFFYFVILLIQFFTPQLLPYPA